MRSKCTALGFCLAASLAGQSPTGDALRVSLVPAAPAGRIEFHLSRQLEAGERMALIAGNTDISAFLVSTPRKISLAPSAVLLPAGEVQIHAWLVTPSNQWRDAGTLKVKVKRTPTAGGESQGPQLPRFFTLQQNSSLQFHSQPFYNTTSRLTYKHTFQELTLLSSVIGKFQGQGWHAELQSNLLGTSQERNALRYSQLGAAAPPLDLSSYSAQFESRRVKAWVGDQSFGTSRQLLNGFTGRGVRVMGNFGGRFDLTVGITSGAAVQGYDHLLGFEDSDNRMVSATLGVELRKVPGAARVEITGLEGSARQFWDNSEEGSSGVSARFAGNLWKQRLTWDAGIADSVADVGGRGAHYAELNFQPLRDAKLTSRIKTTWTVTFREERVDPGYRSLGAFVESDIDRQQLDVSGNVGALQFTFDHNRSQDNLAHTELQWTTYLHQTSFNADLPLRDFLGLKKDRKTWLPHITYSYFHLRNFSTEPPRGMDAEEAGPLPDTRAVSHSVALDWGKRVRFGYRFSFDGQQNYGHVMHSASYGWSLAKKLEIAADGGIEESTQSTPLPVRTFSERLSARVKWKPNPQWVLSANFSGTRIRDSQAGSALQGSLDLQAQWRMFTENVEKGRRVRAEWNARYSNRYSFAEYAGVPSLYKVQYAQAGLTFTFF